MSQIINNLKRIQKLKENQLDKVPIVEHQAPIKTILLTLSIISILVVIVISIIAITKIELNKNEISGLLDAIKIQQKRINNLTVTLNNTIKTSNTQINDLNVRLDQTSRDFKIKVYALSVSNDQLKETILDDKKQIGTLIKNIKTMNKRMDELSTLNNQIKDIKTP